MKNIDANILIGKKTFRSYIKTIRTIYDINNTATKGDEEVECIYNRNIISIASIITL